MIQRDEADLAVQSFAATYSRSQVAVMSATNYSPLHWLTRYPLELPPTWNLLGLFTKDHRSQNSNLNQFYRNENINVKSLICEFSPQFVWSWIFFSMLCVTMSLKICSRCYEKMFPGIRLISNELVLLPFRLLLISYLLFSFFVQYQNS